MGGWKMWELIAHAGCLQSPTIIVVAVFLGGSLFWASEGPVADGQRRKHQPSCTDG